jgi:hypothetical protein
MDITRAADSDIEQPWVCDEDRSTVAWGHLFAQQRAGPNGVPIRFWTIRAMVTLFALDIRICLTYIPEKMSICYYMTERDRKGYRPCTIAAI